MSARPVVFVVPRWGGSPSSDWYPWLAREAPRRLAVDVQRIEMPSPDVPVIGNWVFALERAIEACGSRDLILVGHSVGAQAVVRTLPRLAAPVHGTLLIAPWFFVDEPWDTLRPWQETPIDTDAAQRNAGRCAALLSTNDPFTADYEKNAGQWRDRLGADVRVLPNKRHFNEPVEPDVLEALAELVGPRP